MVKKSICRLLLTTDLSNREIAERSIAKLVGIGERKGPADGHA